MPGTKFEMFHFNGPDDMFRVAMRVLGIGLNMKTTGDPLKDPNNYTEEFEIIDSSDPSNNREGLTRSQCEDMIYNLYCDEIYR